MNSRIGVVAVVIENKTSIDLLNHIISEHSDIIVGRLGLNNVNGRNINVISLVVDGSTDDIGALSGKLGALNGISVRSALSKKEY